MFKSRLLFSICFCLLQKFSSGEKSGKYLTEGSPHKCYAHFCLLLDSSSPGHGRNLHLVDVSKVLFWKSWVIPPFLVCWDFLSGQLAFQTVIRVTLYESIFTPQYLRWKLKVKGWFYQLKSELWMVFISAQSSFKSGPALGIWVINTSSFVT